MAESDHRTKAFPLREESCVWGGSEDESNAGPQIVRFPC